MRAEIRGQVSAYLRSRGAEAGRGVGSLLARHPLSARGLLAAVG